MEAIKSDFEPQSVINTVKTRTAVLITNTKEAALKDDDEDWSAAIAINQQRIEAGIAFLYTGIK